MLLATINSSIVLIAMPDIFRGIGIDPLVPGNTGYLLWMIMGFLVVTAVLVVSLGRLGDMYGRVRIYNLGFADLHGGVGPARGRPGCTGDAAALWLIGWRIVQGIGGACLMANSSAIITDAFPAAPARHWRWGSTASSAIAGSFLGLVLGGLLGPIDWHLVFLVSVPVGVFGTIWAYLELRDTGERRAGPDRLVGQHHVRRRPDRRAGRHHLRHPALRRPRHGLDQPVRPGLPDRRGRWCSSRSSSSSCRVPNPMFDLSLFRDPRVHVRQRRRTCSPRSAAAACSSC